MKFTIHVADARHLPDINRLIVGTRIGSAMRKLEGRFWFARVQGRVVGCIGVDVVGPRTVILTHLVVEEGYRRQGVGMSLFRNAIAMVRGEGATTLAFITMYYHFNRFKREGFRTEPRRFLPDNVRGHWMFTTKRYMKCAAMIQEFSK